MSENTNPFKSFISNPIVVGIGFIATLLGTLWAIFPNEDKTVTVLWQRGFSIVFLLSIFSILYLIYCIWFYRKRDEEKFNKLENEFNEYKEKFCNNSQITSKYQRYEEIVKKVRKDSVLKYGYIKYKPFFWKDDVVHKGIGYDILNAIFENKVDLKAHNYQIGGGAKWSDVFTDLCKQPNPKFDIIITPLFETRSRLHEFNIAYCTPLFHSNIGIFIRESEFDGTKRKFKEAISYLKTKINSNNWRPEYIQGELSGGLVRKHFPEHFNPNLGVTRSASEDDDFIRILERINTSDFNQKKESNSGDFAFMEVFKANSIINQDKAHKNDIKLVNILEDNELLYPVSFVVRKEDTVLRNLINIKLLELRRSGKLEEIIKNVAKGVHISDEEFKNIFVQDYDLNKLV